MRIKLFLMPRILRLGESSLYYLAKDCFLGRQPSYWLGSYHDLMEDAPKSWSGTGKAYNTSSCVRINKATYDALLEQRRENFRKFKVNNT